MSGTSFESALPPDALELAGAIATRSVWQSEVLSKITAALQGEAYVPQPEEVLRDTYIGRTAFNLAMISAPEMVFTLTDQQDMIGQKQYEKTAKDVTEHIDDEEFIVGPDNIRGVAHPLMTELQSSSGLTDEDLTKQFARTLKSARELASERGVSVASVYLDDDLYFEAERREFSLEEAAEVYTALVEAFSGEAIRGAVISQFSSLVPQSVLDVLEPGELEGLIDEFVVDPNVTHQYAGIAEMQKEALRQMSTFLLSKIYGLDSLQNLTSKHKLTLMPRRPLVKEVFDTL